VNRCQQQPAIAPREDRPKRALRGSLRGEGGGGALPRNRRRPSLTPRAHRPGRSLRGALRREGRGGFLPGRRSRGLRKHAPQSTAAAAAATATTAATAATAATARSTRTKRYLGTGAPGPVTTALSPFAHDRPLTEPRAPHRRLLLAQGHT
jgi:hypothetical protein